MKDKFEIIKLFNHLIQFHLISVKSFFNFFIETDENFYKNTKISY